MGEHIKQVVHNQIKSNKPPETKLTYQRLLSEGFPKDEAIRLIACVVSNEIYHMMKEQRPFDEKGFVEMLKKLPKMPWD